MTMRITRKHYKGELSSNLCIANEFHLTLPREDKTASVDHSKPFHLKQSIYTKTHQNCEKETKKNEKSIFILTPEYYVLVTK